MPKTIAAKPSIKRSAVKPGLVKPGVMLGKPGLAKPGVAKPGKPGKAESAAVAAVPPAKPSRPGVAAKPNGKAAPAQSGPTEREQALVAEIGNLKTEIAKLTQAASRAKGPQPRTLEQITAGVFDDEGNPLINGVDVSADDEGNPNDWRVPLFGAIAWIKPWRRDQKTQAFSLVSGKSYQALLAIPRDADGPYGSEAREIGEMSIHSARTETGLYTKIDYLNAEELGAAWDDERNG